MPTDSALSNTSSQAYTPDARNDAVLVYVNGRFVPREQATVSVFDAGYVCGDGVWEGVRLVDGRARTSSLSQAGRLVGRCTQRRRSAPAG